MDKSRIIAYTVAVVSEFALAHNMTAQEAFRYLKRHKGLHLYDLILKHSTLPHHQRVSPLDDVETLELQKSQLEDYKRSLISEAVTGKVDLRGWKTNKC